MTKQFSTTQSLQKRLMMTVLAVLLSGTNCLFCCGQLLTFAGPVEIVAEESCTTRSHEVSGEDNCCSEDSSKSGHSDPAPCNDECCILSAPLAEIPGVSKLYPQQAITAQAVLLWPTNKPTKDAVFSSRNIQPLHSQDTYLRCCVFLI